MVEKRDKMSKFLSKNYKKIKCKKRMNFELKLKIKELSQGVESESKKFDEEIKNIRSLAQNKINMVSKKKSEKLRRNTTAIKELEEKKNSIIGQITTSHIEGKISHEEFKN